MSCLEGFSGEAPACRKDLEWCQAGGSVRPGGFLKSFGFSGFLNCFLFGPVFVGFWLVFS